MEQDNHHCLALDTFQKKNQKTKHEYFLAVKHYLVSDLLVFYNPGKLNYV